MTVLPPQLVIVLAVAAVGLSVIAPWPGANWAMRLVGVVVLAGGAALCVRHARLFDRVGTNIKTFDDPDVLVHDGAFRWTRNPMYLGFTFGLLGLGVALGSLAALSAPMLFFLAADRWYIPFEERRMSATFGADYDSYRQRVRRWVGRND